jgi:hypothetical protein
MISTKKPCLPQGFFVNRMDAQKVVGNNQHQILLSADGQKRNSYHPVDGALFFHIQPRIRN